MGLKCQPLPVSMLLEKLTPTGKVQMFWLRPSPLSTVPSLFTL